MAGVAVIGVGHWGKNHARAFKELWQEGVVDRVCLCDENGPRLSQLSEAMGVEGVHEYRSILDNPEIHAVSVATPSASHHRIAIDCMEAGKDILVEKPMTMSTAEAADLVRTADKTGRILMAGHIFRYHPAVRELRRRMQEGEFGKILTIVSNREAFGVPRSDMGVVFALGIHELDLFCDLMAVDYPRSITAMASQVYNKDIEETASIVMDFGDVKGYAFQSWMVPGQGKRRELLVVGSEKSARVNYLIPDELLILDIRVVTADGLPAAIENEGEQRVSLPYAEPLKEELRHFMSCVDSRQRPLSDGEVGMRAVAMAGAALTSVREGRSVTLTPVSP